MPKKGEKRQKSKTMIKWLMIIDCLNRLLKKRNHLNFRQEYYIFYLFYVFNRYFFPTFLWLSYFVFTKNFKLRFFIIYSNLSIFFSIFEILWSSVFPFIFSSVFCRIFIIFSFPLYNFFYSETLFFKFSFLFYFIFEIELIPDIKTLSLTFL